MPLALMIEGQEGVAWEDWLALARACEEHGVDALFRSDHYLSQTNPDRAALDAWAVIPALAAQTTHLIVGGSGRSGTIDPASRWADEYNTVFATAAECAERREKLARACERAGASRSRSR